MTKTMSAKIVMYLTLQLSLILGGCQESAEENPAIPTLATALSEERGPNNGRLLYDGDFALELAIFETGVPPEYRAWASLSGNPLAPTEVELRANLTRLGAVIDNIGFAPQGDFLRGDMVIYEPHSFVVDIVATHAGTIHRWSYESFEGRTRIDPAVSEALGIVTAVAGPAVIEENITAYGRITINTEKISHVSARFDGNLEEVYRSIGDQVEIGDRLALVESNQSLTPYTITAPLSGMITERHAQPGEQTEGRQLFTITDTSTVWADLSLFPADRSRVDIGSTVSISSALTDAPLTGTIDMFPPVSQTNQAVTARVVLDNADGRLIGGSWISAKVKVAATEVPLAVRREALQNFRDFTVVFAKVGDDYEVRMLDLGRQSDAWVEVLGGLEPGATYVTQNSYILKADVEKSGASHDH